MRNHQPCDETLTGQADKSMQRRYTCVTAVLQILLAPLQPPAVVLCPGTFSPRHAHPVPWDLQSQDLRTLPLPCYCPPIMVHLFYSLPHLNNRTALSPPLARCPFCVRKCPLMSAPDSLMSVIPPRKPA
jgi:hypothetical protein